MTVILIISAEYDVMMPHYTYSVDYLKIGQPEDESVKPTSYMLTVPRNRDKFEIRIKNACILK